MKREKTQKGGAGAVPLKSLSTQRFPRKESKTLSNAKGRCVLYRLFLKWIFPVKADIYRHKPNSSFKVLSQSFFGEEEFSERLTVHTLNLRCLSIERDDKLQKYFWVHKSIFPVVQENSVQKDK